MEAVRVTLKLVPEEKALGVLRVLPEPAGPCRRGIF